MSSLDLLLERLVNNCSIYDEMPHSFDDTLIDKLVDSIEFEESSIIVVRNFVKSIDFESRCIPIQMIIRLLDAAIVKKKFHDDELLLEFVQGSEDLLPQARPPKLLDDLFRFYQRPEVFAIRKPDAWLPVIRWAINEIDDDSTSVFLRRQYQTFICQLQSSDARRLLIISGAVEIFIRRTRRGEQSNFIVDVVTRILDRYSDDLEVEELHSYVESIRNAARIGENSLRLLVKLKELHQTLTIPLTPGTWQCESNRVDLICFLLESNPDPCHGIMAFSDGGNDERVQNVDQLVDLLLYSPAVKLHHKTKILHRMSEKQVKTFLEQLNEEVKVENKVRIPELSKLLPKLAPRVTVQQIATLFESLGARVLESSLLLRELSRVYGPDIFSRPELSEFKNRLRARLTDMIRTSALESEWEQTDTALEIAYIFPCFLPESEDLQALSKSSRNSPYVMSMVLKLMRDHYGGIPDDLLRFYILESADPAPKLVCMRYLCSPMIFGTLSREEIVEYLEAGLSDNGMDMRQEALKLAELAMSKLNLKDTMIDMLTEYKNDRWIGRYVRRLLYEEHVVQENESVVIVREMLASLSVHGNDDEIKDCY
ncbi:Protein CBG20880 [Caenorhabditis briggsae]|uniref:Protein CBG20880 n=1 Tax=Caenorhabditis briggsae TaxID=6238 RepID=A8XYV3_CAEBR|nr:Protein CBG20880 [Caenorhabditis briggsae]CAP37820.2 Protein CBG20880 [Caenorhabditis briggsae]